MPHSLHGLKLTLIVCVNHDVIFRINSSKESVHPLFTTLWHIYMPVISSIPSTAEPRQAPPHGINSTIYVLENRTILMRLTTEYSMTCRQERRSHLICANTNTTQHAHGGETISDYTTPVRRTRQQQNRQVRCSAVRFQRAPI